MLRRLATNKKLLVIVPVVMALVLAGLFLPARKVSIEPYGMLSLESKIVISVGYEVAYAAPDEVLLRPSTKDAMIGQSKPTTNKGSDTKLEIKSKPNSNQRAVLEFDTSDIPSGSTVTSATLYLYIIGYRNIPAEGRTHSVYRLTRTDWVELKVTWNIYKTGSDWTTPGGDFTTDDSASATVPQGKDIWVGWTVTNQVQYAIDNTVNTHFLLKDPVEDSATEMKVQYASNNYITDLLLRPKLAVTYTTPENISNLPTSKDFGNVYTSQSYWSKGSAPTFPLDDTECFFTVTNNSSAAVNIAIRSTDFSGGKALGGWDLGGAAGENIVVLRAGASGTASEGAMFTLTTSDQPNFISGLLGLPDAPNNTKMWELKMETPTSFSNADEKTAIITLTATF